MLNYYRVYTIVNGPKLRDLGTQGDSYYQICHKTIHQSAYLNCNDIGGNVGYVK